MVFARLTIYSVGHIRPPAIIAQINPHPGSRFPSYQDIIRLDKTGDNGFIKRARSRKTHIPHLISGSCSSPRYRHHTRVFKK